MYRLTDNLDTARYLDADLLNSVDYIRAEANRRLGRDTKAQLGQFMTPAPIARLMASMLRSGRDHVSLLDAGAGVGSLFAACVVELCSRADTQSITVTAYEIDPLLAEYANETLSLCDCYCRAHSVSFTGRIVQGDFIQAFGTSTALGLFAECPSGIYDCAVINPPYRKINRESDEWKWLKSGGQKAPTYIQALWLSAFHF